MYTHAESRYPNIAAELYGSGYYPPIHLVEEFAGVSRNIVAAVVEDNEELTDTEFRDLASRWGRGPVGYLASPVLQVIDPATNKGKRRRRELEELVKVAADTRECEQGESLWEAGEVVPSKYHIVYAVLGGRRLLDRMETGETVTYAEWRCVCRKIQEDLEWKRLQELKRRSTRTRRSVVT